MKPSRCFVVLGMLGLLVNLGIGAASRGSDSPQPTQTPSSSPTPQLSVREAEFSIGDVFVGMGDGKVQWRRSDGTSVRVLETGKGGQNAGIAFDSLGNLYVADFDAASVSIFDRRGNLIGTFGEGYDCHPESIIFDRSGNAYVGQADCSRKILKFDSTGKSLSTFRVATGERGSDWLDLASDQCTLYYTSEDRNIRRFNLCSNSQLQNLPLQSQITPGKKSYALRLLPAGGLLVGNQQFVTRFDSEGKIIRVYGDQIEEERCFFALNLDPDGKSFWTAGLQSHDIYKFDIETGRLLLKFNAESVSDVGGLAVFGEIAVSSNTTQVTQEEGKIRVAMESAILFNFNRYDLKPEAGTALAGIKASLIDKHPGAKLIIEGHTDDVGTDDYNLNLSRKRAQSVAEWMSRHGIEASRVKTNGYGKSRPKVPNTSDENRARNRRVEIVIAD